MLGCVSAQTRQTDGNGERQGKQGAGDSQGNTEGPGTAAAGATHKHSDIDAAGATHKHSEIDTMHSLVSPIQDTLSVLDLSEDLALIDQINTKLQQMQTLAHHDIDRLGARVENLQRQRENIELSMKSLHTSAQNKSTRSELKRLQNDIFDSARSLTALNMELNTLKLSYNENLRKLDSLDTELGALNDKFLLTTQSQDLPTDADDPEALEANSNLVRLKLFQSLGLKFNPESKEVLILNKSKNNITMLQIDDTYNEYFISNFIWENM